MLERPESAIWGIIGVMVSVTHSLASADRAARLDLLTEGLGGEDAKRIEAAIEFARPIYGDSVLGTGESTWSHAVGMGLIVASLRLDADARLGAILFAVTQHDGASAESVKSRYGPHVAMLVEGLRRLNGLRMLSRSSSRTTSPSEIRAQTETLRKMLLAMVEDIRVVLLRLASRTQTLRFLTDQPGEAREQVARESLDIYAPLANRLGIWQIKWEMEDLSFRFLEPDTYKRVARMLDERRAEREEFIREAMARLHRELAKVSIKAEIQGRPKHIYSICNKMREKRLDFSQVYDVRALRVLVNDIKECYAVLGIVHQIWTAIPQEFDDYILKPKGNNYQSLHTAVLAGDGRSLEVQIRTHEMHHHAELGIAAHWRYKEGAGDAGGAYDDKIALLRNLLSWRDEVADSANWVEQFKQASLDDAIYALTPQGRVIDLPRGATPVDFAYRLHTEVGHRCRGAKVDGHLVTLNTPLESGQTVEIVTAKEGGPSRDWLNPMQGYVHTGRARQKIKQYFSAQDEGELLARGRSAVVRELQRDAQSRVGVEELAARLGFATAESLYAAVGRAEIGVRSLQKAIRGDSAPKRKTPPEQVAARREDAKPGSPVLVFGVGELMTSLSRCCRPAPPDPIEGFTTRGRGVSIHRIDCKDFLHLASRHPERIVSAEWAEGGGDAQPQVFAMDIAVEADDRQGLLLDITTVLSREEINVIGVNTRSADGKAHMRFTVEVDGVRRLNSALALIRGVSGVSAAHRG